jgi:DNA-directed RNA polymerase specialized sigma24 family protein
MPSAMTSPAVPLSPPVRRPRLRALRSDEALARRAGAGDEEAVAVLYARYALRLEAYCRSIVRNDEDARDALRSTMTNAWLALRRRHRDIVVRPWLYRIAHNEAVTVLRRRRPAAELSELVPDPGLDPHARALVREDLGATVASIRALPGRLALPLLLREPSGLTHDEVGAVLGTPPADARKAVFEARSALSADRAALAEDCAAIRETLSGGDGRRRRARRVRSHLRGCAPCREWDGVQRDLRDRLAPARPPRATSAPRPHGGPGPADGPPQPA